MADETRTTRFDRGDFSARPKYADRPGFPGYEPTPPTEGGQEDDRRGAPYRGDALVTADFLRSLRWSTRAIELLLAGPESASIHEIAARQTTGEVRRRVLGAHITPQVVIVEAVWDAIHGSPGRLLALSPESGLLTLPLLAYLLAAVDTGLRALPGVGKWFTSIVERSRAAGRDISQSFQGAQAELRGAGLPMPLARQLFSLVLVSTAIQEITASEGIPAPVRDMEANPAAIEGRDASRGLTLTARPEESLISTYPRLRRLVDRDRLAAGLPGVLDGQPLRMWVSLADFRQAARAIQRRRP